MFGNNGEKIEFDNEPSNVSWRRTTPDISGGLFNTHPETQNPPRANGEKKPTGGTVITARIKKSGERRRSRSQKLHMAIIGN